MKKRSSRLLPFVVIGVVLIALGAGVVLLVSGSDPEQSPALASLPLPQEVPPDIAVVIDVPSSQGEVSSREFDRAMEQQAAQKKLKTVPAEGEAGYEELEQAALGELLDSIWIRGQAAEMGVSVTPAQVTAELENIKRRSFKSEAEYQTFLASSHFSERDTRERVELQLLSTDLQDKVGSGAKTKAEGEKDFAKFVSSYQRRWRSRTVCAPEFANERCANGEAPEG
ncbi:MAG TPA: SurA N-terminal domain-containing protein [Solirubrobacterales bacterium]|nr:SurA N-terminal domain-containing protein [Solirubrobacterales bacterium]